jgi:hypothetical protein
MLITYTLLAERADPLTLGLATWAYGILRPELMAFYLFASAVSAGGVLIAQALSDHFIEEERLVFPIGGASWRVINAAKQLRRGYVVTALAFGFIAQLTCILRRTFGRPDSIPLLTDTRCSDQPSYKSRRILTSSSTPHRLILRSGFR